MVDTHFHLLEMRRRGLDLTPVLEECRAAGMSGGIDIGVDLVGAGERLTLASDYDFIYHTFGLAPACVDRPAWRDSLAELPSWLKRPRVVALGEIGLDWHWNYGTRDEQIDLFEAQLVIAEKVDLPVVIHNRDADSDVLSTIRRARPGRAGVMHCFSSDWAYAAKCLDMGFMISFAGNITYKKTEALRGVARRVPDESLLIETDSPYLAPQTVRGQPNRPDYVLYTYEAVAGARGVAVQDLISTVQANYQRLFRIS